MKLLTLFNNFFVMVKSQNSYEKLFYLMIFLLPILAISVRHWISNIFIFLFLLSVYDYFFNKKHNRTLEKQEYNYIYILLFYFCIFLLSSVVNGWGEPQTHILGTMLRFLAIIPMLLMFRRMHYLLPVLIAGSIIACVVNIAYLYDNPGKGFYSHLFSGPVTLLFSIFIIPVIMNYKMKIPFKIVLVIILLLSILTVFELGSRSAFIAIIFVALFYTFTYVKGVYRFYSLILILLSGIGAYYGNDNVKMRIDRGVNGISIYFNEKNPEQATSKFNSIHDVAARFEMWRASKYFVPENPILGFGPDEYENNIKKLIDKNLINSVAFASHPHNGYFHELYAKGLLGLIAMLLVLYYPAYVYIVNFKSNRYLSILGLSVIISFSAYSLTESAPFNNNNFSSIMLIYISIIFVSLFQKNNELMSTKNE